MSARIGPSCPDLIFLTQLSASDEVMSDKHRIASKISMVFPAYE